MSDKQRIIDLQAQVRIARLALGKILYSDNAHLIAEQALDKMMALEPPAKRAPLEGVLGWSKRP